MPIGPGQNRSSSARSWLANTTRAPTRSSRSRTRSRRPRRARTLSPVAPRRLGPRTAHRASQTPHRSPRNYPSLLPWSGHSTSPRPRGSVTGADRQGPHTRATSSRRSRHLTTVGTGWSFIGPLTRASNRGPLPAAVEASEGCPISNRAEPEAAHALIWANAQLQSDLERALLCRRAGKFLGVNGYVGDEANAILQQLALGKVIRAPASHVVRVVGSTSNGRPEEAKTRTRRERRSRDSGRGGGERLYSPRSCARPLPTSHPSRHSRAVGAGATGRSVGLIDGPVFSRSPAGRELVDPRSSGGRLRPRGRGRRELWVRCARRET